MPLTRAVVSFASQTGLPEDAMQNVWHFETLAGQTLADRAAIDTALTAFYTGDPAGAVLPLVAWISGSVLKSSPDVTITFYEVDPATGIAGSPKEVRELSDFTPAGAVTLPTEVSVCVSFHADLTGFDESQPEAPTGPAGDVHPRARRRGRIFVGGFNSSASAVLDGRCVVATGVISTLVDRATDLLNSNTLSTALWIGTSTRSVGVARRARCARRSRGCPPQRKPGQLPWAGYWSWPSSVGCCGYFTTGMPALSRTFLIAGQRLRQ